MSARDELPPGWSVEHIGMLPIHGWRVLHAIGEVCATGLESRGGAIDYAWRRFGITREEYTAMRAAVERLREAEGEIKVQGHMLNTQYLEAEDDRAKCEAWEERADKAEAALAKVTAERDEARAVPGLMAKALDKRGRTNDWAIWAAAWIRARNWEGATPTGAD